MKKSLRITVSVLLVMTVLMGLAVNVLAATPDIESAMKKSVEFMQKTVKSPQVGSVGGEWAVIGISRSGQIAPQEYYDRYYATVAEYVKACEGVLHEKKYTEYSRVTLALTAIGADPKNVAGYNLLTPLGDFDKTIWQGINGPIWALIALDSGNYDMPINASAAKQATRQMYIDEILSRQHADGGWTLSGEGGSTSPSDPDLTGMALQALAKYQNQSIVKAATVKAVACLSAMQDSEGGYSSWDDANVESVVQVIVALCELGIDPEDSRFVKNGNTLLDNLMSFSKSDGSFVHSIDADGYNNQMSSEQGLYALVAVSRALSEKSSLYRMNDVTIKVSGSTDMTIGLPGKHEDIKKVPISTPGVTFSDISEHDNLAAIEALAAREIINGVGGGKFSPDDTMTRAQFATIAVKALGLTPEYVDAFSDVASSEWYAAYIGTAYSYGLINGKGDRIFDPEGTITKQEAATLVMRVAALCGMDAELEAAEIRDVLAQFGDYMTVDDWARVGLAFCYGENILDQSDMDINAKTPILRCEIAQMIFNTLGAARLV